MSNTSARKTLGKISRILTWVLLIVTIAFLVVTIVSSLTFERHDRNLFGIRFYIVLSDSMSLSEINKDDDVHFNAGDIVLSKRVKDLNSLQPGDIISFVSMNSDSYGKTITHMIHEVIRDEKGTLVGYRTFGTNKGSENLDEAVVEPEYVLGKYGGKIPRMGYFFRFMKTTPGYIVCILVPFLLLIVWQLVGTVRLFRQYRREQMADIVAEREQLAQEREESAQMMAELRALRDMMDSQNSNEKLLPEESEQQPQTAEQLALEEARKQREETARMMAELQMLREKLAMQEKGENTPSTAENTEPSSDDTDK